MISHFSFGEREGEVIFWSRSDGIPAEQRSESV